jgi:hypothetical protein
MPGPGNPNGSDRKMTIDGMLNDVNSALNSNAVAGPNDWNGADPDASGNTNLDDMGKNTPNRTCMVGPNQMHRDNVSESSGTTDHDSRINNAQNRPALVGSIYKSDASVDVDGMIWTPDSLESPDSSPGSSSLNTSDTSPRSAVPSNSPIPQLDGVYLQAIKNLERVPSGSIIGLLEQIQALLADRGVGRSELEGEWLTSAFPTSLEHLHAVFITVSCDLPTAESHSAHATNPSPSWLIVVPRVPRSPREHKRGPIRHVPQSRLATHTPFP